MNQILERFASLRELTKPTNKSVNSNNLAVDQSFKENKNAVLKPQKKESHLVVQNQLDKWINLDSIAAYTISPSLKSLYESTSYQTATLYGFRISQLREELKCNKKGNLRLVWSLFQMLNWQRLSVKNIQNYIYNLPQSQEQVEEIEIQNNKIKFNKLAMSLELDIYTGKLLIAPKSYEFNRFIGRNYFKSFTKIQHQLNSYQFNNTIQQIQSNHLIIAVKTSSSIFLINPDGKMKSFSIAARDLKICGNRCFFVRLDNSLGSIFMQTSYIPKLNQFALQESLSREQVKQGQFLVGDDKFVAIVQINLEQNVIVIRKMQGQRNSFILNVKAQGDQSLVSKKGFIDGNWMYILLFLGQKKNITRIISYKFYITI